MILSSRQLTAKEWPHLGGKAKGLLWLKSLGLDVPEFYVLSALEIKALLQKYHIQNEEGLETQKASILAELDIRLSPFAWQGSFAVRSSGLQEDSEAHSFAGIFHSYLDVQSQKEIAQAVFAVIKSVFSPVAASYMQSRGLKNEMIEMCVIVQKMIAPAFSGVSFGLDLQSGDQSSAWISVTEGLGEKLVSGEVQGQEFIYKNQRLKTLSAVNKNIKADILKTVGDKTLELSKSAGQPMDVEWAYDGQLWFLQARPVTAKIIEKIEDKTVFDNSNIQESYCGVTTPLTFTYASVAYSKVYMQLMKLMQLPPEEIEQARWNLENMLGLVNGRVYYNINNWYAGLLHLPSFGKRKKEMEDMMGLEKPVEFVTDAQLSRFEKLQRIPKMISLIAKLAYNFNKMDQLVEEFDQWFWSVYKEADIASIHTLNESQIFHKIRVYQDRFIEKWSIPVLNDTKVMMDMGKVKRTLEKYQFQGELKSIIYGAEVESVKPTLEIHHLSKVFAQNTELRKLLSQYSGRELIKLMNLWHPLAAQQVQEFIHLYGDRCIGELKLETITMRQDPEILFAIIRSYIDGGLHLKEKLFVSHGLDTEKMFAEVFAQMGFFEKYRFRKNVIQLKKSIAAREKMRMHRTRNFGLMRALYLELGKRWQVKSYIAEARDIFYLTYAEVFEIGTGRAVTAQFKKLIALRKEDFKSFQDVKVPTQVEINFPAGIKEQNMLAVLTTEGSSRKEVVLQTGLACSQGVIEGEVIFVERPDQVSQVHGKILLAERTDPGWTPLFALIKGVIIEKGSMLSHSAVIAREMGIPAVLNIQQVTKTLQSGDWVRLDGNTGTIEILKRKQSARDFTELQSPSL